LSIEERVQLGVCILRVEPQPEHLLITITTNSSLDRTLYSARPPRVQQFSDPDGAVEAVAQFLRGLG